MRVMIANGEEKGEDPPFAAGAPPSDPPGVENGAALAPSQTAPNISPRSENVPILPMLPASTQERHPSAATASARPAPAGTTTETQRGRTNGKQRAPILAARPGVSGAESSSDDVGFLGGDGKEGRDVDGQCGGTPIAEGEQHAARLGAAGAGVSQGVSQEFSPTNVPLTSEAGGGTKTAAGFVARAATGPALAVKAAPGVAVAAEEELERCFEAELRAKGWELRRQEGDGNCLFRAISQHIYGDPGMHGDIRGQCLDFMRKERDHYSQFVSEAFDSYVSRKEQDGVHGNNPEMQAASELFNRAIEVYVPEKGTVPINIFHGGYRSNYAPIRVSYHGNSHYNAVIDPEEASVGQGLGVPGLSKEAAEKESLKRALAESCSSAHQVFPGDSPAFFKGGRGAHGSFGGKFGESDLRATESELEQAAITASLADFHGTSSGGSLYGGSETHDFGTGGSSTFARSSHSDFMGGTGKGDASFSVPRRGGRGSHSHSSGVSSSGGRVSGRGATSRASGGRGERRGGGSAAWGSGAVSSAGVGGSAGRVERGGWGSGGGSGGGSGNYARKRRRPGSPNSPPGEGSRKSSPSSADSSSAVREMVWSYGFPLARVLHAHDLVGDSVEDMLVLLTSDAFQPPGNNENEGGATAASCSTSSSSVRDV